MWQVEAFAVLIFGFVAMLLPSALLTVIGWKTSGKVKNEYLRLIIRAGVLSLAFAPTIYGHAGLMPAFYMIFLGSGLNRVIYGVMPILVVWGIGAGVALSVRIIKNTRINKSMRGNT